MPEIKVSLMKIPYCGRVFFTREAERQLNISLPVVGGMLDKVVQNILEDFQATFKRLIDVFQLFER